MHKTERLLQRKLVNPYARVLLGSAVLIVLTLLCGTDYNGAGTDVITAAMGGAAVPWAWALKIVFTALTIGCGFKGGEIVPAFFIGATFGCFMGGLAGHSGQLRCGAGYRSGVLRGGELPHCIPHSQRRTVRRWGAELFCHCLRRQLYAFGILWHLPESGNPLFQTEAGKDRNPCKITAQWNDFAYTCEIVPFSCSGILPAVQIPM